MAGRTATAASDPAKSGIKKHEGKKKKKLVSAILWKRCRTWLPCRQLRSGTKFNRHLMQ